MARTKSSAPASGKSTSTKTPRATRTETRRKTALLKEVKAVKTGSKKPVGKLARDDTIDSELNRLRRAQQEDEMEIDGQDDDSESETDIHVNGDALSDDEDEDENAGVEVPEKAELNDAEDEITVFEEVSEEDKAKATVMPTPASRGVVYLGRIPHGFYEEEMRQYFTQFGAVTRLRLSRNKKTGKSKHYAFVEFQDGDVADVVASTMNGYLMFGQVLVCKRLPHSQVHPELFKGANRKFRPANLVAKEMKSINVPKSREAVVKTVNNLIAQEKARVSKIKALGIEYDFSEISFATLAAKAGFVEGAAAPAAPSAPAPAPMVEEKKKPQQKKAKVEEKKEKAPVVEEPAVEEKPTKKGKRKAPTADADEAEAEAPAAAKKAKSAPAAPTAKPSPAKQTAAKKAGKKARR